MSGKFSSTGTSFNNSSILRQEEYIRDVVQSEVFLIFEDIKVEIETKIKSIDKAIIDIRHDLSQIKRQKQTQDLTDILEKIEKVEAEMQLLKYNQQFELKTSRAKSLDKERKPIFRKNSPESYDFGSVILGLEGDNVGNERKVLEKKEMNAKPPLPKEPTRSKSQVSIKNYSLTSTEQRGRRNPVLEESGSVHRWLHENNNRQSSCLSSIIREQDIEESVFY